MYNFLCEKLQKKDSHNSKYFFMKICTRESEKVALMLLVIKMYNNNSFPIIY